MNTVRLQKNEMFFLCKTQITDVEHCVKVKCVDVYDEHCVKVKLVACGTRALLKHSTTNTQTIIMSVLPMDIVREEGGTSDISAVPVAIN